MISKLFRRIATVFIVATSAIAMIALSIEPVGWLVSGPTPVPIVRKCINRPRVSDEILDLFFQEVNLIDPNDLDIKGHSTHRPSGSQFTDEEKANMQIVSVVFQAQKPGTGKYLKGRYDVYFENDIACKIQFTDLDW